MTDSHNIGPNSGLAYQRWGVDLRDAVRSVSAENALCESCVWEKLMDFPEIDDPAAALAQAVHDLNAERARTGNQLGDFLAAVFGRAPGQDDFEPIPADVFFGNLGDDSPFRTNYAGGGVEFVSRTAFPTPGPIDEADKRDILRRAGYRVVLDETTGWWTIQIDDNEVPILNGGFSGDLAWRAAWEVFLSEEEVFRHYKGGVYIRGCDGRNSEDGSDIVVYEHVWPHEPEIWTRPKAEFDEPGRFVRMGL